MPAEKEVSLVIRARDRTRAVLRRVGRGVGNLARRSARLAGALAVGLAGGAFALGKSALELENAAETLGVSVEELQAVQRILARSGVGAQDAADSLRDLQVRAGEAAFETGEASEALGRLGFTRSDLQGDPIELLFRLQEQAKRAGFGIQELNQILDQLGGDQLVQFSRALRGGSLRAEVRQIADSDAVRSTEGVADAAETMRIAQEELAVAMARLATIMESNIPALVSALERAIAAYEREISPEGIIPGGVGATIAGTAEALARQSEERRQVLDLIANGATLRLDPETNQAILATERNTREGPTL